ncbi:MAG: DUF1579 family protein [Terracidiphilus sp.]
MRFVVCILVALGTMSTFGQQPSKPPADGLNSLSFMEGDWSGQQDFNNQGGPAMVGNATDNIAVCIEQKYICEMLSTTLPNRKPTDTRHFISFDKQTGKYTAWWFNDTSVHPMELVGDVSGNKLVLLSDASAPGPVLRATYERTPEDKLTYLLEMKQGDSWTRLFLTTYGKK